MYDLLLTGGVLVDPANDVLGQRDVALTGGTVVEVAAGLDRKHARQVLDVSGKWVFPGLVDPHVHLDHFGGPQGHRMLARAGVTCALDMSGRPDSIISGLKQEGTGLSIAFLYPAAPGMTLSSPEPDRAELSRVRDFGLARGALGLKILGGHYPLTPDATALAIRVAHETRSWCAVHAGTTVEGSDIAGLESLIQLADGLPLHIAHVNSYCRGQKTGDPLLEASRALQAIALAPLARSESYLSTINGTVAHMDQGVPRSNVTKTCLQMGGYPPTADGMEAAIQAGWAMIHGTKDGETVLLPPADGLARYRERNTRVPVSFPVNPPGATVALAVARSGSGFAIPSFSTDGGAIPRNTTLKQGLALVAFGALTLEDLVVKACLNPARMLGLHAKGHLGPGADADLAVVDPSTSRAEQVIARGQIVVRDGQVVGQGGRLITTAAGVKFLAEEGVEHEVVTPDWL